MWDESFYFFMTVMIVVALATPLTLMSAGTNRGAILAALPSPFSPAPLSLLQPVRLARRHKLGHIMPCIYLSYMSSCMSMPCHAMPCHFNARYMSSSTLVVSFIWLVCRPARPMQRTTTCRGRPCRARPPRHPPYSHRPVRPSCWRSCAASVARTHPVYGHTACSPPSY